jgi:hypothetical protein
MNASNPTPAEGVAGKPLHPQPWMRSITPELQTRTKKKSRNLRKLVELDFYSV